MRPNPRPGLRPGVVGRAVGIGLRLATQRVLPAQPAPRTLEEQRRLSAERVRRGEVVGRRARNVSRGGRNFGRAVWNPFARATGTLWYEVTGMFFALFALFFVQHLWSVRMSARSGPAHRSFVSYAVLALVFGYFAVSSFARARRGSKQARRP